MFSLIATRTFVVCESTTNTHIKVASRYTGIFGKHTGIIGKHTDNFGKHTDLPYIYGFITY